jgi:cell division septal protein FtsQ
MSEEEPRHRGHAPRRHKWAFRALIGVCVLVLIVGVGLVAVGWFLWTRWTRRVR